MTGRVMTPLQGLDRPEAEEAGPRGRLACQCQLPEAIHHPTKEKGNGPDKLSHRQTLPVYYFPASPISIPIPPPL
jgi:hypothetical protein